MNESFNDDSTPRTNEEEFLENEHEQFYGEPEDTLYEDDGLISYENEEASYDENQELYSNDEALDENSTEQASHDATYLNEEEHGVYSEENGLTEEELPTDESGEISYGEDDSLIDDISEDFAEEFAAEEAAFSYETASIEEQTNDLEEEPVQEYPESSYEEPSDEEIYDETEMYDESAEEITEPEPEPEQSPPPQEDPKAPEPEPEPQLRYNEDEVRAEIQQPLNLENTAKFLLGLPVLGDVVKEKFIENMGRETDDLKLRAIRVDTQNKIIEEWKEQKQCYIVRHFNSQEVVCNVDKNCEFKYIKAVYYEVSNPVTNKNVMLTSSMYHNLTRHHMAYFHEPMLNLGNSPMGFYDSYMPCLDFIKAIKDSNAPQEVFDECGEIADKIAFLEEQRFAAVIAKDIPDMSVFEPDEYEKENNIVPVFDMLRTLVKWGAEDIHIKAGCRPIGVLRGDVTSCPSFPEFLTPERTKYYAYKLMTEGQQAQFEETLEMDISFRVPTVARFRCNIYWSQGAVGMVLRVIPTEIRPVEVLGVPLILKKLVFEKLGLCLVTGQTGSGKTTTLAAIVEFCNVNRAIHILTLENPVEYVYQNKKAIFTQRAIEIDSLSFPMAMRAALREKPDIILIGEMRDPDTIMAGLKAAETGHLVMSTLHTNDAVQTINRIVNTFPPHEQETIREQVGHTVKACVAQRLIKRFDKPGRVCAIEIMLVTPNARGQNTRGYIIRNEVNELYKVVQTSAYDGMQSMNMALFEHYRNGVISPDEALSNSDNPDELTRWMREDVGLGADMD